MGDTIELDNGIEVEVAEDPESADLIATAATLSVQETTAEGLPDYESIETYASTKVQIRPAIRLGSEPHGRAFRQKLLEAHRQVEAELQQVIENRLSEPGFENWEATDLGDFDA